MADSSRLQLMKRRRDRLAAWLAASRKDADAANFWVVTTLRTWQ